MLKFLKPIIYISDLANQPDLELRNIYVYVFFFYLNIFSIYCWPSWSKCHSQCDSALSLLSIPLMAFCFLLPLFSACTHPFTASFCGQLGEGSCTQVSSTPATGPGLRLYMDCLSVLLFFFLSLSLNRCLVPHTNIAVLSFLVWSLQYLLPLFALFYPVFSISIVHHSLLIFRTPLPWFYKLDNISSVSHPKRRIPL